MFNDTNYSAFLLLWDDWSVCSKLGLQHSLYKSRMRFQFERASVRLWVVILVQCNKVTRTRDSAPPGRKEHFAAFPTGHLRRDDQAISGRHFSTGPLLCPPLQNQNGEKPPKPLTMAFHKSRDAPPHILPKRRLRAAQKGARQQSGACGVSYMVS